MKLGAVYLRKAAAADKAVAGALARAGRAGAAQNRIAPTELDFRAFIRLVMPSFQFYRWSELLVDRLEQVVDGKLLRLIVQVPPRHGKSQLVTRLFPAYYLLRHPERFVAVSSYGAELAEGFSRNARDFYRDAGGRLDPSAQSIKRWGTEARGGLWACGVGGPATGKGAHLGIIDDPIKNREEAESPAIRRKLKDWYGPVFRTRIEPEDGAIVLVQTRWHEEDLVGQVLATEAEAEPETREGWHIVDLPAEAEPWHERPAFPDCVTVEEDWREPGEALCPERYNLSALHRLRTTLGSREYAALYQQNPRPDGGAIFAPSWWRFYREAPEKVGRVFLSVDCTFKDSQDSDFVCIAAIAQKGPDFYVLDVINERMDIVRTMAAIASARQRWGPSATLIEAAANGHAVLQLMGRTVPGLIPIKPSEGGSKVDRAQAAAPLMEAGNVYLPASAPWLEYTLNQFALFPAGKNDDVVDAVTQGLRWATARPAFRQTVAAVGYGARPLR